MDNKYITFEDYLRNELTPNESKGLLKDLEQDNALKQDFEDYKMMREYLVRKFNIKTDKQFLEHLEKCGDKYFIGRDDNRRKGGGSSFRSLRFLYSMAATLLILFGLIFGFKIQVEDAYNTNNLLASNSLVIVEKSRSGDDVDQTISESFLYEMNDLFKDKQYDKLIAKEDLNVLVGEDLIKAKLLKAESFLQMQRYEESIVICDELLSDSNPKFHSMIQYVLARAYIGNGDKKEGMEILKGLTDNTRMEKNAKVLLKELNGFKHWLASL